MKRMLSLVLIMMLFIGCADKIDTFNEKYVYNNNYDEETFSGAMRELRSDYLKGDELSGEILREAGRDFKYDVLRAKRPVIDKKKAKQAILRAKKILLDSDQKDNYIISSAVINEKYGMPESRGYIFIHFKPVPDKLEIENTTYLVAINRFYNRVVYSDVFHENEGDPFYKYSEIIKIISN